MPTRRVAIVDDDIAAIEFLEVVLDEPDITTVGHSLDARRAIELIDSTRPDVLILDLDMPHVGGAEVAKAVRELHPGVAIVIHSTRDATVDDVPQADAFVSKSNSVPRLLDAIRSLPRGEA